MIKFKKIISMALVATMVSAMSVSAFAITNSDETIPPAFQYTQQQKTFAIRTARAVYGEWEKQKTVSVSTDLGVHLHTPYILWHSDDSQSVKASTKHTADDGSKLYGYTRARFETAFGKTVKRSDSGRCFGTGSSSAESPMNSTTASGWTGTATTYCGDRSTM